jgi:XTP/dITP diphosphohydrolase
MFQPEGYTQTFSELSPEEKNAISHRGRAVKKLAAWLNQ